jgi:hypothetical protein
VRVERKPKEIERRRFAITVVSAFIKGDQFRLLFVESKVKLLQSTFECLIDPSCIAFILATDHKIVTISESGRSQLDSETTGTYHERCEVNAAFRPSPISKNPVMYQIAGPRTNVLPSVFLILTAKIA